MQLTQLVINGVSKEGLDTKNFAKFCFMNSTVKTLLCLHFFWKETDQPSADPNKHPSPSPFVEGLRYNKTL